MRWEWPKVDLPRLEGRVCRGTCAEGPGVDAPRLKLGKSVDAKANESRDEVADMYNLSPVLNKSHTDYM